MSGETHEPANNQTRAEGSEGATPDSRPSAERVQQVAQHYADYLQKIGRMGPEYADDERKHIVQNLIYVAAGTGDSDLAARFTGWQTDDFRTLVTVLGGDASVIDAELDRRESLTPEQRLEEVLPTLVRWERPSQEVIDWVGERMADDQAIETQVRSYIERDPDRDIRGAREIDVVNAMVRALRLKLDEAKRTVT